MKRALVTGIDGFVGSHLADALFARRYQVFGTVLDLDHCDNIRHIQDRLNLFRCDIQDAAAVCAVVERSQPQEVYHLAGIAHLPTALADPRRALQVNVMGTANLFEAVRTLCFDSRLLCVGSATAYGAISEHDLPVDEEAPLHPIDPYGVSKASADMLAYQYFRSYGLQVVRTRSFNHIGPRQSADFAISGFAKQIAEAEAGRGEPEIIVGNLGVERDFTDVRDVAQAYWLAATMGKPGESYNICSGAGVSVSDLLERLVAMSSLGSQGIEVKVDPKRMRPSDVPSLVGDCSKFVRLTGWQRSIPLDQSLHDVLDYWREKVAHSQTVTRKSSLRRHDASRPSSRSGL